LNIQTSFQKFQNQKFFKKFFKFILIWLQFKFISNIFKPFDFETKSLNQKSKTIFCSPLSFYPHFGLNRHRGPFVFYHLYLKQAWLANDPHLPVGPIIFIADLLMRRAPAAVSFWTSARHHVPCHPCTPRSRVQASSSPLLFPS
jgi:hypothetical protein